MRDDDHSDEKSEIRAGEMSDKRRERVRLEISREAARLFWEQGVDGTTGEQIADAVGLSVRTIWRYFRNKESCAEPVLAQDVEELVGMLRRWPREMSFEDYIVTWAVERYRDPKQKDYDIAVMRMIALSRTEPALRTALLMAYDRAEGDLVEIVANRLRLPTEDLEVCLHAAAIAAVVRVIDEYVSAAMMSGVDPASISDPLERIARAVRTATGGAIGDPIDSVHRGTEHGSGGNDGE